MELLIKNGTLFPMTGQEPFQGDLLIRDGKIKDIAKQIPAPPDDAIQIYDASGKNVYPGIIEAHCHLGISEECKGKDSDDCNELTNPVTPYLRAIDAINPMDASFSKAVSAGITSAMVGPGSSNVVGGQFVFMKTAGSRCIDDLIVKAPAAMKVAFGENPKTKYGSRDVMPCSRMGIAALLREELTKARDYYAEYKRSENASNSHKGSDQKPFAHDFHLDPWIPVFEKKIPMKCHVHRADDIFTVLRIAKEFDLDITFDHCTEGHLIADAIKNSGFPAIIGPGLTSRNKIETVNASFKTVSILNRAGVLVSVTTDHPVTLIQSLPLCAGIAVRDGLPLEEALKCITINAAKICRVDDRVGSLEVGKDADIAIYEGCPLETMSHCLATIINGEVVYQYDPADEKKNDIAADGDN